MHSWGIEKSITCFVIDNAANMIACAQLLQVSHVPCFAHTLNLVVKKKAIEQTPELHTLRLQSRQIVALFKSSATAKQRLSDMQQRMGKPIMK